MKILYEIRIKKEKGVAKEFVTNIKELSDYFMANGDEIVDIYKVYKEDGEIVKSERLKCVLKGNRLSIVTIKEKPKRIKSNVPRIISEKVISKALKKVIINKIIPTSKRTQFGSSTTKGTPVRPSKIKFKIKSKQESSARPSKIKFKIKSKQESSARPSKIKFKIKSKQDPPQSVKIDLENKYPVQEKRKT